MDVILKLLAEDKTVIPYRKSFARLTGNTPAAILLQQVTFHWENNGRRAFYKFHQPCDHALYQAGDSWDEELEFSMREFNSTINIIGTKIKRGDSKQQVLETEFPERQAGEADAAFLARLKAARRAIVLYWTDANQVTWYLVNERLLAEFTKRIYLGKSAPDGTRNTLLRWLGHVREDGHHDRN